MIKSWTHEIPARKYSGLTREKFSDPRRHDGTVAQDPRDPQWHETQGCVPSWV